MEKRRADRMTHQHKQIWTKDPHGGRYRKVSSQAPIMQCHALLRTYMCRFGAVRRCPQKLSFAAPQVHGGTLTQDSTGCAEYLTGWSFEYRL